MLHSPLTLSDSNDVHHSCMVGPQPAGLGPCTRCATPSLDPPLTGGANLAKLLIPLHES